MYIYYLFVVKAAHACNANRRKHTPVHVLETQNTHTMTLFRKSGLQPNIASEGLMH
jgi:hypothetical protein